MATINATTSEKVISLKQFLGINENPDGDNKLKTGEATVCRNFKVTNSGNLMKRFGTSLKYRLAYDTADVNTELEPTSTVQDVTLNINTFKSRVAKSGKYVFYRDTSWQLDGNAVTMSDYGIAYTGTPANGDIITVDFKVGTGKPVKGMWHGWCTKHELAIAACDSHLWMLMDNEWLEAPSDLGSITTDNDVFMFGFDEKVYVMTGHEYCEIKSTDVPRTSDVSIATSSGTASIIKATWETKITETGSYRFTYHDVSAEAKAIIERGTIYDATVNAPTFATQESDPGEYTFIRKAETVSNPYIYIGSGFSVSFMSNGITRFLSMPHQVGGPTLFTYSSQTHMWTTPSNPMFDLQAYGIQIMGTPSDGAVVAVNSSAPKWTLNGSTVTLSNYGVSYSGTAGGGDKIVVTFAPAGWYLKTGEEENLVTLSDYGISTTGSDTEGRTIDVEYTAAYIETQWSMTNIANGTHGYVPLVAIAIPPNGGGELQEEVNKLNGKRRVTLSPDGTNVTFQMPEKDLASIDYVIDVTDPEHPLTPGAGNDYEYSLSDGTVTFTSAPALGVESYEVGYSVSTNFADTIAKMRYAELYAGTQDNRVFIYGDGSNRTFYSGIDNLGHPRADYFPDLYEVTVGDTNTPLTGLIRHYSKMLAFKPEATFSIDYGIVTLADGLLTPAFYTTPVNRILGNEALGQMQLVLNAPRTLCQGGLYEWRNGSSYSANLSVDERQAKRISDRIYDTLQKMDFLKCHCYDDNLNTEYYIMDEAGNCLVQNYTSDAWYYYTGLNARMGMAVDGKMYLGTYDGKIIMLDETRMSDQGKAIDCLWESGSMDFGAAYMRKYSALLWVGVKSEHNSEVTVTVITDRSEENTEVDVEPEYEWDIPKITRVKIKVKKFVYYKLCFKQKSVNKKCTIVDTEIKVRYTAQAK